MAQQEKNGAGFVYDSKGRRNPFLPLVTPEGVLMKLESENESQGLMLEGIIYDDKGMSFAIVNGGIVKIGDAVNEYKVLKIEEHRVIFIKDSQIFEVDLKKEE